MLRAVLELLLTVFVVIVARAILTSVMRGIANMSNGQSQQQTSSTYPGGQPSGRTGSSRSSGDLHRDPVCGTYVAESTPFRKYQGGQLYYYCSDACREKHTLVAR